MEACSPSTVVAKNRNKHAEQPERGSYHLQTQDFKIGGEMGVDKNTCSRGDLSATSLFNGYCTLALVCVAKGIIKVSYLFCQYGTASSRSHPHGHTATRGSFP